MWNYKFVLPPVRVRMVQLTTEQRVFVKKKPFICVKLLCFSLCYVIWPIGSYNYSAIHSIKFPEVSQRTFKTKGLISIEGTFFWDTLYSRSTYIQPYVNILCKILFIYSIELFVDLNKRWQWKFRTINCQNLCTFFFKFSDNRPQNIWDNPPCPIFNVVLYHNIVKRGHDALKFNGQWDGTAFSATLYFIYIDNTLSTLK